MFKVSKKINTDKIRPTRNAGIYINTDQTNPNLADPTRGQLCSYI